MHNLDPDARLVRSPTWWRRVSRLAIAGFVAGLVVVIFWFVPVACTAPDATVETLRRAGYNSVEVGGYAWFACGEDDMFATRFSATNGNGARVEGVVCCGAIKNCTIRW
jgi:hypothetical protein